MSPKSAPRCSVSALAVAMMVMNASAASVDMGRVANGADAEERYSAVDKAITWGYNGGRALQLAGWCSVVSDTDTYCCGFGAKASCLALGLEYEGPETPCEVRLVTSDDGTTTCEGLEGESGNLEAECDCEDLDLFTEAPATDAPSPTLTPTAAAPTEEGMTAPPTEEGATPPPTEEGATAAPADAVVSPAPTPGSRGGSFTMAPLAEGETAATLGPAATPALDTAAPGSTPQPTQPPASSSEAATLAPASAPALGTTAPESAPPPTPAPGSSSEAATLAPAATPALGTTAPGSTPQPTPAPAPDSSSEGASMVGVVVGAVAGALALVALGLFLGRRRTAKSTDPDPPAPPSNGGDNLEHGRGEQHQQRQLDTHSDRGKRYPAPASCYPERLPAAADTECG